MIPEQILIFASQDVSVIHVFFYKKNFSKKISLKNPKFLKNFS